MTNPAPSLYTLLPAIVRQRDLQSGAPLQQLLAILDQQAGLIGQDLERMYDNWFIETCEDWVVPYIGDLLGYELAAGARDAGAGGSALLQALAPRRAVASLIRQRRRKGTASALHALAADLAGWHGHAVEYYQRLVVAQHLDHRRPERTATASVRARRGRDSAFDTMCALADMRRIGSQASPGRFNIASVGLHVYRLRRYPVTATPAYCHEDQESCFTFSILGNDAPLMRLPLAGGPGALPIGRFELEAPGQPRQANPALYGAGASINVHVQDWPQEGMGGDIPAHKVIPADLTHWSGHVPKGHIALDPVLGRIKFPTAQAPAVDVLVSYGYGAAMDLGGGEYQRSLPAMPELMARARVRADTCTPGQTEFASIGAAVNHWQAGRNPNLPQDQRAAPSLLLELADSGDYQGLQNLVLQAGESAWIVAAPGARPVLWNSDLKPGRPESMTVRGAAGSRLVLDGVLLAGRGLRIAPLADGDLCEVLIRHSTLVPGWGLRHDCTPQRPSEPSIVLDGSRTCLRIEHSIVGAIRVNQLRGAPGRARIVIADSIVDATSDSRPALAAAGGETAAAELCVARSTIIGTLRLHALTRAENSIFSGLVEVARRQAGCMRYCYAPLASRTPRRYRCQPETAIDAAWPDFVSTRYGDPDYLRLHLCCGAALREGADDGAEIGVYHDLFEPQRLAVLDAGLQDAVPAGADAAVIIET